MLFQAPLFMSTFARWRRARFWPLLWLLPIGILSGILSGALVNGGHVIISPLYFQYHGYWIHRTQAGAWISILQEGAVAGGDFSIASIYYGFCVILISRGDCPFNLALRSFYRCVWLLFAICFSMGLNATMLLFLAPAWTRQFIELPTNSSLTQFDFLRWIWVDGSIIGLHIGGFLSVIINCLWFNLDWQRYKQEHSL